MDVANVDPATITDINGIVEARRLSVADARRLAHYVAGAIRPNRDRPIFDLCRLISELAATLQASNSKGSIGEQCLGLLLGPSSSVMAAFNGRPPVSEMYALLAFAEFLLMHDDCSFFAEQRRIIDQIAAAKPEERDESIKAAVSVLASRLRAFRTERFAAARHEKVFRSLLSFLGSQRRGAGSPSSFDDKDIVAYWDSEIREGNRLLFRTVVKYFLTLEAVATDLSIQRALNDPLSLYADNDGQIIAPVELATESVAPTGDATEVRFENMAEFLRAGLPDNIKLLTGAERERLVDLLECGPFTTSRPLTVLRYIAFGAVQSGIANFLRRGSGGDAVAQRVNCDDAPTYTDVTGTYAKLSEHLQRLLLIAAFLAREQRQGLAPELVAAVPAAELDAVAKDGAQFLRRLKREGFDEAPEVLASHVIPVTGELVNVRDAVSQFMKRVSGLERSAPLDRLFETDRQTFSQILRAAYVAPQPQRG